MPNITISCEDATVALQQLPKDSVDLIIADPPYNLGKDYGNYKDDLDRTAYLDFAKRWLSEAHRILKPSGTIYVFMGFKLISTVYDILERDLGMHFVNWIVWHYTQGSGRTRGFSARHDDVLMFSKTSDYFFDLDGVRVPQKYYRERNNMRGANPGDVWQFSHVHYCNADRQEHSTQKPEALIERMILASSKPKGMVVDPFAGSGTTLRVCQQLDRDCVGYELNEAYISMIEARLALPFKGFDSLDPRMERVPLDLRARELRDDYLQNHKRWFLKNHENETDAFEKAVKVAYPEEQSPPLIKQDSLFES